MNNLMVLTYDNSKINSNSYSKGYLYQLLAIKKPPFEPGGFIISNLIKAGLARW